MNADIPFMVAVKRSGRPFNKKDSPFFRQPALSGNDRKPAVAPLQIPPGIEQAVTRQIVGAQFA